MRDVTNQKKQLTDIYQELIVLKLNVHLSLMEINAINVANDLIRDYLQVIEIDFEQQLEAKEAEQIFEDLEFYLPAIIGDAKNFIKKTQLKINQREEISLKEEHGL